jgi:hypothetical protein
MRRPPWGLTLVVAVLAAGTAVTSAIKVPAHRLPRGSSVEVVGASAVCPDLRQAPGLVSSRVSLGAAPLPAGTTAAAGSVRAVNGVGTPHETVPPVRLPGQVAVGLGAALNENALAVSATDALAGGLEVEQVTRGERGFWRGLAGLRCEPPQQEAWFVGGSTLVDHVTYLCLVNLEDTPATVDVSAFSLNGPVDARAGQGITVQPHSRLVIPMDTLIPDRDYLAVHVVSRRGRVAMDIRHHWQIGPLSRGIEFVPESVPPATSVVVPGIPQGIGVRYLMVANPGADDTTVSVRVTTRDRQFIPSGMDQIDVPAQHTRLVPLNAITSGSALAATVVSSGGPVLASAFVIDAQVGSPYTDFSYTTGSLELNGSALLTDLVIDRPTESTLIFSAPESASTVLITPIQVIGDRGPLPAPRSFNVPAGRTVTFSLSKLFPPGANRRLAVQVSVVGSGPVYAARYLRSHGAHGPLTTLLDLQGPALQVPRPAVLEDPDAGFRR